MADEAPTEPGSPGAFLRPSQIGKELGRYRIDGVLGEGGMGVVYAAFDPDLQRKVALKVLRRERTDEAARARLLREARALAKVSHPNVVAVHEVGSVDGRDFIAMEYVDGTTLGDWVRIDQPPEPAIVDAYIAAGRGLAAAHAAGLVHRDFKPHNVLRTDSGRVVVTDFGLARDVDATKRDEARPSDEAGDTSISVTQTGHVLGTPAYMAPEQWRGEPIGAAADQFAYCVAFWEALTGKRPFRGSDEEILAAIESGVRDAGVLPKSLRPILVRGLSPKVEDRWPSMDALLAEAARVQARPFRFAIAGGVVMTAGVLIFGIASRFSGDSACPAPSRDPSMFTGPVLGDEVARWKTARDQACKAPQRTAKLACLDAVLERVAIVREASAGKSLEGFASLLVEPAACLQGAPSLTLRASPEVIAAVRADAASDGDAAAKLMDAADPCAKLLATSVIARRDGAVGATAMLVDRCGDDHLRVKTAFADLLTAFSQPGLTAEANALRDRAEAALTRIPQPNLRAMLHLIDAHVLGRREQYKDALAEVAKAEALFGARIRPYERVDLVGGRTWLLVQRGERADLEAARAEITALRPLIAPLDAKKTEELDFAEAMVAMLLGDLSYARASLVRLWKAKPPPKGPRRIVGRVIDRESKPVAGIEVYAASTMVYSTAEGVFPLALADLYAATTDADGGFTLDAPTNGTIVAIDGKRRTYPVPIVGDRIELVMLPTRKVSGRVELGEKSRSKVLVGALVGAPPSYVVFSPLAEDNAFVLDAVPSAAVTIAAMSGVGHDKQHNVAARFLDPSSDDVTDLVLRASASKRTLHVLVRSTLSAPLDQALVTLSGVDQSRARKLGEVRGVMPLSRAPGQHPSGELPAPVKAKLRRGDLLATFTEVPQDAVSACAMAIPKDLQPQNVSEAQANDLDIRCVRLAEGEDVVVVETPPQKRID